MLPNSEKIDPRRLRTRKLLLDAFSGLMTEKRFKNVTVRDITNRATVNRATFYAHFPDKYAIIEESIRDGFSQALQNRVDVSAAIVPQSLKYLFLAVTEFWTLLHDTCPTSFQRFEALIETQMKEQLCARIHTLLVEHTNLQTRHQGHLSLVSTALGWSIYGTAMEWCKNTKKQSAGAFAEAVIPLIAVIIPTPAIDTF